MLPIPWQFILNSKKCYVCVNQKIEKLELLWLDGQYFHKRPFEINAVFIWHSIFINDGLVLIEPRRNRKRVKTRSTIETWSIIPFPFFCWSLHDHTEYLASTIHWKYIPSTTLKVSTRKNKKSILLNEQPRKVDVFNNCSGPIYDTDKWLKIISILHSL